MNRNILRPVPRLCHILRVIQAEYSRNVSPLHLVAGSERANLKLHTLTGDKDGNYGNHGNHGNPLHFVAGSERTNRVLLVVRPSVRALIGIRYV